MVNAERIPNGYRITEAGILPAEWQVKRLSEVATELTERAGHDMYETVSISAGIGFVNQAKNLEKSYPENSMKSTLCCIRVIFLITKETLKHLPKVAFTV